MTIFTGTPGADNFAGADNVADTFNFTIANLSGSDISGMERFVLQAASISFTLNNSVVSANGVSGLLSARRH